MKYRLDIVRIEIMDEDGDVAVQVEAMDESCAVVEMKVATNVDDWDELSRSVAHSLMLMQLVEEAK